MWKIAIIDDERQVLKGMKRSIPWDDLGAEWVGEAMNGEDGLEVIRRTLPDIVITDLYMPVMNGLDMMEQLRNEGFRGKIIILSGYSDFEHARQALRFQVTDYVSKPISLPTLRSILSNVVQELEAEEEKRMRQWELEFKMTLYEPFVEKEWVRSAAVGTLDSAYRDSMHLPPSYEYWLKRRHVTVGIELIRDERAKCLSVSDWNLFRFAVSNIACEVARRLFPDLEYTELHSTRALLIIHPEEGQQEQLEHRLDELGVRLTDSISTYLKLVTRIGIGGIKDSWTRLSDSTEEAFRAMDQTALRCAPAHEVYRYRESSSSVPVRGAHFPVKFSYKLAAAMKASQEAEAHDLVLAFITEMKKQEGISQGYVQMLGSELWGIIAYSLYESGFVLDDLFTNDQIAKEISGLVVPDQLASWLMDKISKICTSRQWKGSSKHRQIVDFMTSYIHEHYAEELTLAELSDKVFISRNHLSILFKNITGETFNNYLTRVRIEKARELLMERNMLVYEVAERVGYRNIPYFSTLFKKITGMNPTELIKN
ncbi:AraC family transcriptional regulator [Paenibacillus sp. FSL R7-0273]|uniref:response regulator transcription factor n=1 Tax=Paenibacillus sp. FSL R7-0273 TaxID=1536772 RepID=UPI0004F83357|nr:response regulator transcription factor [Paenibacillus sp. FSL R7-0273]AIQ47393.1 AraC family transcriptional regulator [Paenibacillus sp. FSL R7-0273]OMF96054.1 DNA-binding response regulator [Paenibacillus sp. FSL R7-0273]